jgi:hypothetical protein
MRANPGIDTATAITELRGRSVDLAWMKRATGPVERAFILPPASRIGPLSDAERAAYQIIGHFGHYEQTVDRESAYESQEPRRGETDQAASAARSHRRTPPASGGGLFGTLSEVLLGKTGPRGGHTPAYSTPPPRARHARWVTEMGVKYLVERLAASWAAGETLRLRNLIPGCAPPTPHSARKRRGPCSALLQYRNPFGGGCR